MKAVCFHPEAEAEMLAAAAYYEAQQDNLGKRFLTSVQEAIGKIQINPLLYPIVDLNVRRCLTKTFPYGVLFRVLPDRLVMMAVVHLHRDPDYWKTRRFEPITPANPPPHRRHRRGRLA